jgi:hypothetical protein
MGARETAGTVAGKVSAARSNPYVRKVIEDEEFRANVLAALAAARSAYGRVNNGKAPTKALMEDKKLHRDLKQAADSLRVATDSLRHAADPPPRKRRRGRMLIIIVLGFGTALAVSEGLRTKVLDALFGKEEEFDYTSTTAPDPAPAPEPASTT